jgi:hypothetical protein
VREALLKCIPSIQNLLILSSLILGLVNVKKFKTEDSMPFVHITTYPVRASFFHFNLFPENIAHTGVGLFANSRTQIFATRSQRTKEKMQAIDDEQ